MFRLLAWTSLIVIFFAVGYGATALIFKWLDRNACERGAARTPSNLADTPEEAQNLLSRTPDREDLPLSADVTATQGRDAYVTVTISVPEGGMFKTRQIRCSGALREDTIKQALAAYMDAMKESQILSAGAQDLNIFQSG